MITCKMQVLTSSCITPKGLFKRVNILNLNTCMLPEYDILIITSIFLQCLNKILEIDGGAGELSTLP